MPYEKEGKSLVAAKEELPEEFFRLVESEDEQAIVERLTRADAQQWFGYSYPIKTKEGVKEVIGISWDGAKEIAQLIRNIRCESTFKVEDKDNYFYAIVPVTNLSTNTTILGIARQSKYIISEGNIPTDRLDETAFVKAINKAQRNGILSVVSQKMIADIVASFDPKFIKKLVVPPQTKVTAEKAKAQKEETKDQKPKTEVWFTLGFNGQQEQWQMRSQLFDKLVKEALAKEADPVEAAKQWTRGMLKEFCEQNKLPLIESTENATKQQLNFLLQKADELIKLAAAGI